MWRLPAMAMCLLSACAGIKFGPSYGESMWSARRAARWDGPACGHVLYSMEETVAAGYRTLEAREDPSPEAQILLAVCTRRVRQEQYRSPDEQRPRVELLEVGDSYLLQDDTRLDVLAAAVTVVHVANLLGYDKKEIPKKLVALALFWRRVVDETELTKALEKVAIPPEAKAAFVTQFRTAPVNLSPLLNPDEQRLLVEVPVAVFRARKVEIAKHAALYRRFAELRPDIEAARTGSGDRVAIVTQLEALRSDYMDACGKVECRQTPLWANITRDLAQLHALRNDALASRAEAVLIHEEYLAGLPQAIWVAQREEEKRLRELWNKYQRAKQSGYDEAAARQLAQGAPREELESYLIITPDTSLPDYSAPLSDAVYKLRQESGEVADVEADGTVHFRGSWPTDVKVPAREARSLKAGDQVSFISDGKKGRVLIARRKDRVVQIRGDRVP